MVLTGSQQSANHRLSVGRTPMPKWVRHELLSVAEHFEVTRDDSNTTNRDNGKKREPAGQIRIDLTYLFLVFLFFFTFSVNEKIKNVDRQEAARPRTSL